MSNDWKLPWEGVCRCGETRVRVTKPPLVASACHCNGCQTMSASAYSLSLTLPPDGFEVTGGEPVLGGAQPARQHYFCGVCKTWMFSRPRGPDGIVNLRPSVLEEHRWFVPFIEVMTGEKLCWAETPAKHRFEGFPSPQDYQSLIEEFQKEGGRPA